MSLFLLSLTMCDTELNSLSLSKLVQGAERYLPASLARVGNHTLLTIQYCSGLSCEIAASPRYVSNCTLEPTAALPTNADACSSAISSNAV